MLNLPLTCHVEISKFLTCQTISRVAKTCTKLHSTYTSETFWQHLRRLEFGIGFSDSGSAKDSYKGYDLWILEQSSGYDCSSDIIDPSSYIFTQLTTHSDLNPGLYCQLPLETINKTNSSQPRSLPVRVKSVAGSYQEGCMIDTQDNLWIMYFNRDKRCSCWSKTEFKAKQIACGNGFCLFVDKEDGSVKLHNTLISSPFNPTRNADFQLIMYQSDSMNLRRNYDPNPKWFPVKVDGEKPVGGHVFCGQQNFGILVDKRTILVYESNNLTLKPTIIINEFNFDVLEIGLCTTHLVVLDTTNKVWTVIISKSLRKDDKFVFEPLLLRKNTAIQVTAKRLIVSKFMCNFILINFDQCVRKVVFDKKMFTVSSLKPRDKRDTSHQTFACPNSLTKSFNLGATLVFKWDKTKKTGGVGSSEFKIQNAEFGYGLCWVWDIEGRLWCFNHSLKYGTLIQEFGNVRDISYNLFLRRGR